VVPWAGRVTRRARSVSRAGSAILSGGMVIRRCGGIVRPVGDSVVGQGGETKTWSWACRFSRYQTGGNNKTQLRGDIVNGNKDCMSGNSLFPQKPLQGFSIEGNPQPLQRERRWSSNEGVDSQEEAALGGAHGRPLAEAPATAAAPQ
jgi:hypothetical protein